MGERIHAGAITTKGGSSPPGDGLRKIITLVFFKSITKGIIFGGGVVVTSTGQKTFDDACLLNRQRPKRQAQKTRTGRVGGGRY